MGGNVRVKLKLLTGISGTNRYTLRDRAIEARKALRGSNNVSGRLVADVIIVLFVFVPYEEEQRLKASREQF